MARPPKCSVLYGQKRKLASAKHRRLMGRYGLRNGSPEASVDDSNDYGQEWKATRLNWAGGNFVAFASSSRVGPVCHQRSDRGGRLRSRSLCPITVTESLVCSRQGSFARARPPSPALRSPTRLVHAKFQTAGNCAEPDSWNSCFILGQSGGEEGSHSVAFADHLWRLPRIHQ